MLSEDAYSQVNPDKLFLNGHTLTITHPYTGKPSAHIPTRPTAEYSIKS